MDHEKKCWLIANFEIIIFLGTLLLALFIWPFLGNGGDKAMAWGLAVGFLAFPLKEVKMQIGKLVLFGLFFVLPVLIVFSIQGARGLSIYFTLVFWIVIAIIFFIVGKFAYFTFHNIDDVASSRWLWKNSSEELYDSNWKYALERFCTIIIAITGCIGWIAYLVITLFNPTT
jgi:hypothetical protein